MRPSGPIVVMGVSGSGKSVIGDLLAEALGVPFIDGDDLHPPANKKKMAEGHPLTDDDRWPWLDTIAEAAHAAYTPVVACSALTPEYRQRLLAGAPGIRFAELDVSRAELERRVSTRHHEYMPASLLDSQLATLVPLGADEPGARISVAESADDTVQRILDALELR